MKDQELGDLIIKLSKELYAGGPKRFNAMLDLKLHDCSREEKFVAYHFYPEDWCRNQYGGLHGGIICSVFDTAIGIGAHAQTQHFVTTRSLNVSFLRPMTGSHFLIRSNYTHLGRRVINAYATMTDLESGALCADCLGVFQQIETRPRGLQY